MHLTILQTKLNYYFYSLNENEMVDGYENKIKMSIILYGIIKTEKDLYNLF